MVHATKTSTDMMPPPASRALLPLGRARDWARDLAVIGGVSSFVAPASVGLSDLVSGFAPAAAVAGALVGAGLGAIAPRALSRVRAIPIPILLIGGLGVGSLWGAAAGLAGAVYFGSFDFLVGFSALAGGVAGAIQLGWFWLPYVKRRIARRSTWPLVLFASLLSGGLGWVAVLVLSLFGY